MCIQKTINPIFFSLITILFLPVSCNKIPEYPPTDLTKENIIPKPVSVTANGETFCLSKNSSIYIQDISGQIDGIANYLAGLLRPATGFDFIIKVDNGTLPKGNILLTLSGANASLGDEGYIL